jgi:cation transport ATPase
LNCPYCGSEILYGDAVFCPKCGKSLAYDGEMKQNSIQIKQNREDSVPVAAMLTIVSAAFMATIGCIGIYQNQVLLSYYGLIMASELRGFLIFGVIDIICAAFALVAGMFMLKRKHLRISILGVVFLLASVLATFITIVQNQYGFTDILLFSEISVIIFSFLSGFLIFTSKAEFIQAND